MTSDITINGDDAATTIIERDPGAPSFRILAVAVSGKLTLNGLTVRGGRLPPRGGILNEGSLTINRSIIDNNFVVPADGGGISNATTGTLNLADSFVIRNTASSGGGISIFIKQKDD